MNPAVNPRSPARRQAAIAWVMSRARDYITEKLLPIERARLVDEVECLIQAAGDECMEHFKDLMRRSENN